MIPTSKRRRKRQPKRGPKCRNFRHTFGTEFEAIFPRGYDFGTSARLGEISGLPVIVGNRVAPTSRNSTEWKPFTTAAFRATASRAKSFRQSSRARKVSSRSAKFALHSSRSARRSTHLAASTSTSATSAPTSRFSKISSSFTPSSSRRSTASCRRRVGARPTIIAARFRAPTSRQSTPASSLPQLIVAQTGIRDGYAQRFFKLNLAAFAKHSTVEFRQHAGTIGRREGSKLGQDLHQNGSRREGRQDRPGPRPLPASFANLPAKARRTAEMVTRPEGATREEIIAGTDRSALSVNRQARLAGISVTISRSRGRDRFYAVMEAVAEIAGDLSRFSRSSKPRTRSANTSRAAPPNSPPRSTKHRAPLRKGGPGSPPKKGDQRKCSTLPTDQISTSSQWGSVALRPTRSSNSICKIGSWCFAASRIASKHRAKIAPARSGKSPAIASARSICTKAFPAECTARFIFRSKTAATKPKPS